MPAARRLSTLSLQETRSDQAKMRRTRPWIRLYGIYMKHVISLFQDVAGHEPFHPEGQVLCQAQQSYVF